MPLTDPDQVAVSYSGNGSSDATSDCGSHPEFDDVTTIIITPTGGFPAKQAVTYSIILPVGSLVNTLNGRPLDALSIEAGESVFTVQDAEPPAVAKVRPAALSRGVALDATFTFVFDEPVEAATNAAVTFTPVIPSVVGSSTDSSAAPVTLDGEIVSIEADDQGTPDVVVSFAPTAALLSTAQGGQQYVVTMAAGSLLDRAGLAMAEAMTNFTTVDLVGPKVFGTIPKKNTVVAVGTEIAVVFDESIAAGTSGVLTLTSDSGADGSPWQISLRGDSPLAYVDDDSLHVQVQSLLSSSSSSSAFGGGGSILLPYDSYTLSIDSGLVVDTATTLNGDLVANAYLGDGLQGVAWFGMADPAHSGRMFPQMTAANTETVFTVEFVSRVTVDPKSTVVIALPALPDGASPQHHGFLLNEADVRSSLDVTVSPETSGLWVIQDVNSDLATVTLKFNSIRSLPTGTKVIIMFEGVQTPNILGSLGTSSITFQTEALDVVDVLLDASPLLQITNDFAPTFVGAPYAAEFAENDRAVQAGTADPDSSRPLLTLRAVDPDAVPGTQLVFSIATGTVGTTISPALAAFLEGGGIFAIDASTGVLSVSGTVDFELLPQPRIAIDVKVSETTAPFRSSTATVDLTVLDVNDNAPAFVYADGSTVAAIADNIEDAVVVGGRQGPVGEYWFAIHANKTVGSSIGAVLATDADSGTNGVVTYSWEAVQSDCGGGGGGDASGAEDGGLLSLHPDSGAITVAASLMDAGASVRKYGVTARDGGRDPTRTSETTVSVHILDATMVTSIILQLTGAGGSNTTSADDLSSVAAALQAVLCPDDSCVVNVLAFNMLASGEVEVLYYASSFTAAHGGGAGCGEVDIIPTTTVEDWLAEPDALQLLNASGAGLFFIPMQINASQTDDDGVGAAPPSVWDRPEVIAGVAAGGGVFLCFLLIIVMVVARRDDDRDIVVHTDTWKSNQPVSPYMDPSESRPLTLGNNRGSERGSSKRGAGGSGGVGEPGPSMVISPLSQTSASYIDMVSPTSAARTMYNDDDQYFAQGNASAVAAAGRRPSSVVDPGGGGGGDNDFDRIPTLLERWSSDPNGEHGTESGWGKAQQSMRQAHRPPLGDDGFPPPQRRSGRASSASAVEWSGGNSMTPPRQKEKRWSSMHAGDGGGSYNDEATNSNNSSGRRKNYYTPTSVSDERPPRRTQSSYYPNNDTGDFDNNSSPPPRRSQSDRRWGHNTNL